MRIKEFAAICFIALLSGWQMSSACALEGSADTRMAGDNTAVEEVKYEQSLKLAIVPGAEEFKVGEQITFELVLTNVSQGGLQIRPLNDKAVYCNINGQDWGSKDPSGEMVVIIMPGESIRKKFKVDGGFGKGDFRVNCSYGTGSQGVRPSDEKVFKIVR